VASVARSTVTLALAAAEQAGLLRVIGTTRGGRHQRNRYVFTYKGEDVTDATVFDHEKKPAEDQPVSDEKPADLRSETGRGSADSSFDNTYGKKRADARWRFKKWQRDPDDEFLWEHEQEIPFETDDGPTAK
jgi:hypothetical protein